MRIIEFLQKLNAKSLRVAPKRQSGMVVFTLSAPTALQMRDACEHLRYWPYVKAYYPVNEICMKVVVYVGSGITEKRWPYYVLRSCELMNQCVRQCQALFVITNDSTALNVQQLHRNGFLRPDDLLKPFCDFIDDMNYQENII